MTKFLAVYLGSQAAMEGAAQAFAANHAGAPFAPRFIPRQRPRA